MRILVVDNYDSFTWNLVHLVGPLAETVDVVRNDQATADELLDREYGAIILSPGPCTPNEAGICLDLIRKGGDRVPMLGVCLGLQAMGQAFGARVIRAPLPMHGKLGEIRHSARTLFRGINGPFQATRYHSLIVERASCPSDFEVTAETGDGLIMGLSHRDWPMHGVQFHPESILSEHGELMMRNFLTLADDWTRSRASSSTRVH